MEWVIDKNFGGDERWKLVDGDRQVGRVMRFEGPEPKGTFYDGCVHGLCDGEFRTMKEAAQYVVAEYKLWQAK